MKRTTLLAAALCGLLVSVQSAAAQGTAFTYQGRLNDGTNPANGKYDLTFSLFNASSGPGQAGGTIPYTGIGVSNGLFTVVLDFGANFPGADRWLEIAVRTNGSVAAHSILSPRQALTPVPYAIFANSSSNVVDGSVVKSLNALKDDVTLTAGANVSITPSGNTLQIAATGGSGWALGGNNNTTPANFLGTLDSRPLELRVNSVRALRLEPTTSRAPNVIGGAPMNYVAPGAVGATIGGGGGVDGVGGTYTNGVTGDFGTVAGGYNNNSGIGGAVGGGYGNTSFIYATVSGGQQNTSSAIYATVAGGFMNRASAGGDTVGGGGQNHSTGGSATVAGGTLNTSSGQFATVGGGYSNTSSNYATVGGGYANSSLGQSATVAGGYQNTSSGAGAFVGGGGFDGNLHIGNVASGIASTVAGGLGNAATNQYATVGGGDKNTSSGFTATVGGGQENISSDNYATVAGGIRNISGNYATVGGGGFNRASGANATVAGGRSNTSSGVGSVVGGGGSDSTSILGNTASGEASTVAGGIGNTANGYYSTIPGGYGNTAPGFGSFAAGIDAHATHIASFVWGDGVQAANSAGPNTFNVRASSGANFTTKFLMVSGLGGENAYLGGDNVGGDVQIGSLNPAVSLIAAYNPNRNGGEFMDLSVRSITILGGADVAEPFQVSGGELPKGSVVVIDEEHPGHLKASDQAYDQRVAGIVSGANGITPGVSLSQQGVLEGGQNVALSGRVYVLADASNGPIRPGDLLTASSTPGHAMKVTDHARAQGAILGKAMTALPDGKGMVLVLVTLQ